MDPEDVYDELMKLIDPGMHHERELTQFYEPSLRRRNDGR